MAQDDLQQMLQRAIQLARSGDRAAARLAFIQALKMDSHSEIALLGLVSVTSEPKERMAALRKAFLMYPESAKVAEAMRRLNLTGEQLIGNTTETLAVNAPRPATSDLEQITPSTSEPQPEPPASDVPPARPQLKRLGGSTSEVPAITPQDLADAATKPAPLSGLIPATPPDNDPAYEEALPDEPAIPYNLEESIARLSKPIPGDSGVPVPNINRLQAATQEAASLVTQFEHHRPQSRVAFGRKDKNRAGEGDRRVFRTRVAIATSAVVSFVGVFVLVAALGNPDVQRLVFAPTWTVSPTATSSATPTPGLTPTPSPTPRLTATPSPTFPPSLPIQDPLVQPRPTDVNAPVGVLIEPRIRQAVGLLNVGNLDAAAIILAQERRSAELTGNFIPYYYSVDLEVRRGNLEEARQIVETGEQLWEERSNIEVQEPMVNVAYARIGLAEQRARTSPAQEALRSITDRLEASIGFDPQFIEAYLLLADRYLLTNNRTEALNVLNRGLERNTTNVELRAKVAEVLLLERRYRESLQALTEALLLDPYSEKALQLQVQAAIALGDPGLAVLFAEQYMARYPGRVLAIKLRADARLAEGKIDLALYDYTRALNGDPGDPAYFESLLQRATLYSELKRYDLARQDLSDALELRDDQRLRITRMHVAYDAGDFETALEDAEQLLEANSPPPEAVLMRTRILLSQEELPSTAVQDLQRVLNSATGETRNQTYELLARVYLTRGEYASAVEMINTAIRSNPTLVRRLLRGQIYEAQAGVSSTTRTERNRLLGLALADYEWVNGFSSYFSRIDRDDLAEAIDRVTSGIG